MKVWLVLVTHLNVHVADGKMQKDLTRWLWNCIFMICRLSWARSSKLLQTDSLHLLRKVISYRVYCKRGQRILTSAYLGVPTILSQQKDRVVNLLTLSTFFSAVTATTLQFSFSQKGTPLADLVNAFWLTSLVLSVGAAVNGLLTLSWKQVI